MRIDLAACVGATWIGSGVAGTAELLGRSLRPGGMMLSRLAMRAPRASTSAWGVFALMAR